MRSSRKPRGSEIAPGQAARAVLVGLAHVDQLDRAAASSGFFTSSTVTSRIAFFVDGQHALGTSWCHGVDGYNRRSQAMHVHAIGRPLEGRSALVTGAGGRASGRAIAEASGRAGRRRRRALPRLGSAGRTRRVRAIRVDGNRAGRVQGRPRRSPSRRRPLVAAVEAALGPRRHPGELARPSSAGALHRDLAAAAGAQWAINARGAVPADPGVRRADGRSRPGDVVNMLDIGGVLNCLARYSAYCMTKAAVAALTRCLALELAPADPGQRGGAGHGAAPGVHGPRRSRRSRAPDPPAAVRDRRRTSPTRCCSAHRPVVHHRADRRGRRRPVPGQRAQAPALIYSEDHGNHRRRHTRRDLAPDADPRQSHGSTASPHRPGASRR